MPLLIKPLRFIGFCALVMTLTACGSNPPAPVTDRTPTKPSKPVATSQSTTTSSKANRPTYKPGDWRPDNYTVKKGDTLYSIGLELGYYYKDIAQANNIGAPYLIKVGQVLNLAALKEKVVVTEVKPEAATGTQPDPQDQDGVIITPIGAETASPNATIESTETPAAVAIVAITEPKAIRELYSDEALKKPLPTPKPIAIKPSTPTEVKPDTKPVEVKPTEAKPAVAPTLKPETKTTAESPEDMEWSWPTKGKVVGNFSEAGNKGIDIAGSLGQAITAAAPGKVIYSGSDLRGYGKLVIIKHNATYLSVYAHNSAILVKEGQQIARGQKIAEMGNTDSNTVKLHFEIRRQGKSVDPSKYLAAN